MKTSFNMYLSLIILNGLIWINSIGLTAQSFTVHGVSDMVRIFEDGYKIPPLSDTIKVFGIRGEIISGQLAINAIKPLRDVNVEVSAFMNQTSGTSLPSDAIEWNFVGSVMLPKNTPNQPSSIIVRKAPANFPDYLMAERQLSLKAKCWQAVWLTITLPETADPGDYYGKVKVKSGSDYQNLPVKITVYPLTISPVRHLNVVEWYSTDRFPTLHGIMKEYSPEWFNMLKIYANNMAAHRQNIFQVPMESILITKPLNGRLLFDFTYFDRIADVFWSTGKMDLLETGELTTFGKDRWSSKQIFLKDFPVRNQETGEQISMPGRDVIPFLMPAFENHLRQKGWLNKTIFGIKDEPSQHNALSYKEISSYFHIYAPELRRFDAIESTQVLDGLELAVPKLDHYATWYDSFRNWQNNGHELWFYTVGIYQGSLFPNKTIDVPLIDSRLMHWLNYRYGATGYLHWGWNQWTEDPYSDPDIHIGDGWHVYPVKNGILNSLRWEEMRNGIQDYEYLWLLENKIKELKNSLGTRFSWIDPKQRGKEIAGRIIKGFADRTNDPREVENAKLLLIREIMDSETSPGIYVQTNPMENSVISSGSSVEVCGWAEPGCTVNINGQDIPVNDDGLFLEQFGLDQKTNKITVLAKNGSKIKKIVREFTVR